MQAARVLLYAAAALTVIAALDAWIAADGTAGLGQVIALSVLAVPCVLLARRAAHPGPWTWSAILALETFSLLWQLGRIASGDPFGLLGLTFPIALIVLVARWAVRGHLRVRPWQRRNLRPRTADCGSASSY
ncbi:hypothetical protein [Thermomonospora echinospora]|nr:hypothetical protein [Thermomonospora echinospora]